MSDRLPLPIRETFYPLGFAVEIATNSREVIAAARESWGGEPRHFDREPVRIRVVVEGAGNEPAPEPNYRTQRELLQIVSNRDNFAVCDLRTRFGWCHASANMVADSGWFRWYFLEAMVYLLLTQQDVVPIHAACVARNRRGVLLCGASGAGKSTLAYACARAGWTYVTDDATILLQGSSDREVIGKSRQFRFRPEAVLLFPELEGRGTCIKPNGKPTVEVPVSDFPEIVAARGCLVERIVFLDRRVAETPGLRKVSRQDAIDRLLREMPVYSDDVMQRHRATVETLLGARVFEMRYSTLPQAVSLLSQILEES